MWDVRQNLKGSLSTGHSNFALVSVLVWVVVEVVVGVSFVERAKAV